MILVLKMSATVQTERAKPERTARFIKVQKTCAKAVMLDFILVERTEKNIVSTINASVKMGQEQTVPIALLTTPQSVIHATPDSMY